jgi:hypothetical protein
LPFSRGTTAGTGRPSALTRRMRSRRNHFDVRFGSVEMMISSKFPSRTAFCTDSKGSDRRPVPQRDVRQTAREAAKRSRASNQRPSGRSHPAPAARPHTVRNARVASPPRVDDPWPPCGWRQSGPERFRDLPLTALLSREALVTLTLPDRQPRTPGSASRLPVTQSVLTGDEAPDYARIPSKEDPMSALIDRIRAVRERLAQRRTDRRATAPDRAQRRAKARATFAEDKRRRESEGKDDWH